MGRKNTRDVTAEEIAGFETVLNNALDERPVQRWLTEYPWMLVGDLCGGCRWVVPEKRLGSHFRADFLVAKLDSLGAKWVLVELESPKAPLFTKDGRESRQLAKGISQILEWRRWLDDNRIYARRRGQSGLGLKDITGDSPGLLLIGREDDRTADNRDQLKQLSFNHRIEIQSYDRLIREARHRIGFRASYPLGDRCTTCTVGGRLPD